MDIFDEKNDEPVKKIEKDKTYIYKSVSGKEMEIEIKKIGMNKVKGIIGGITFTVDKRRIYERKYNG